MRNIKAIKPTYMDFYIYTEDHTISLTVKVKEEAERLADNIRGLVYIFSNGAPMPVYKSREELKFVDTL